MTTEITYNEAKLKELLLYVATRLAGDPSNGTIKMNKVLFFSDVLHYANYGSAITGATYLKQQFGPAPKGIRALQEELISAGEGNMNVVYGARMQRMFFASRKADLSLFSSTEIDQVNSVIEQLRDSTAMEVSDLTHRMLGWRCAGEREEIPYYSIFLYDGPLTADDVDRGRELARELQLQGADTSANG